MLTGAHLVSSKVSVDSFEGGVAVTFNDLINGGWVSSSS